MEHFFDVMYRVLEYPLVHFGETRLTLSMLLTVLLMLGSVVLAEMLLRRFFIMRLLRRTHLEPALQYAVGKIIGYGVMALGFYIAFQMAGINLSSLAVLAGAIGVGLGFGLQNIISNFISGLIVLAERPIAIGDRIEVGSVAGCVTKISLRSTTVLTNDNITIIVPNADFITQRVVNWTHGDPRVRFHIPVGVAYGSDVDKVRRLMLDVAAEHPKVLKEPAPEVFLAAFGDSSLNMELIAWTTEMSHSPDTFRSELNFALERKFRANKVEIPFPQRDLHVRSGNWPVPSAKAG
ncbi:MAG: mechanosensitive ion channel family protein [Verrucomicrobia bacterium]|nr:mechanosensitive ion channel family protein [Verrucomicrobiota bacterium]